VIKRQRPDQGIGAGNANVMNLDVWFLFLEGLLEKKNALVGRFYVVPTYKPFCMQRVPDCGFMLLIPGAALYVS
jgi:hypothetical protein